LNHYPQDIELTPARATADCGRANGAAFVVEWRAENGWSWFTRSSAASSASWSRVRSDAPRRGRRTRVASRGYRADQGGQHSKNLERQDPAPRLPQGFLEDSLELLADGGPGIPRFKRRAGGNPDLSEDVEETEVEARPRARSRPPLAVTGDGRRPPGRPTCQHRGSGARARPRVAKERALGITLDS